MTRREPVQRRSRERVEVILQGAAELVDRDGVEALSTRTLAEHTSIPVATIYRYFGDCDEIIAAFLDRELAEIDKAVEAAVRGIERVTFRSMTRAVALAHLRHHQTHPQGVPLWFGSRLSAAVEDRVRQLDARLAASLHASTRGVGFMQDGPHFGAGLIVRLFDRMFEHIFRIERTAQEQEAIVLEVVDMISSYMERYATPAGLEGVSADDFLLVLRRTRRGSQARIDPMPERLYFTESDEANALIATDPMALLIGFALDQQVTVPKAFMGPLAIKERVGTLDPARLAATDLDPVFREKPAIHRFPGKMAERVHELAVHVRDEYGGNADRVWKDAKSAEELRANIAGLPGFGEMKIKSLGAVLANRYELEAAKGLVPKHPTLGDVDSPQALLDYQAAKRVHKAEWSKMGA